MDEENGLPDDERSPTRVELAKLLHVGPARIERWDRCGFLPWLARSGRRAVLFPPSAVIGWLARVRAIEDRRAESERKVPSAQEARET